MAKRVFLRGQILLTDCTFTPRNNVVSIYKTPIGAASLSPDKKRFNSVIARARITSDHTIGMLKSFFCLLHNIRLKITQYPQLFHRVMKYVRAAIILHNLLIGWDDDFLSGRKRMQNFKPQKQTLILLQKTKKFCV